MVNKSKSSVVEYIPYLAMTMAVIKTGDWLLIWSLLLLANEYEYESDYSCL